MVTFYQIRDIDKFFDMIDSCTGRVLLKSSDNQMIDLRKNALIKELLLMTCGDRVIDRLALFIENKNDMPQIQRYLMECYSRSCHK